jgi:putative peptidoglycan lipid II flippase
MNSKNKLGQAASTIGGMTLISRLLGFLRDLAIAMQFGATAAADAFFVAFRIPNVQRKILSEGAVTAAFIPVFTEMRNVNGEEDAWKMTANLFNILSRNLSRT